MINNDASEVCLVAQPNAADPSPLRHHPHGIDYRRTVASVGGQALPYVKALHK